MTNLDSGVAVSLTPDDHPHGDDHDHHHGHTHGDHHAHTHGDDHAHTQEAHGPDQAHTHGGRGPSHGPAPANAAAAPPATRTIVLEQEVLAKNDQLAVANRAWLAERRILALNLMSSPGSGKTTLLERTIRDLGSTLPISVIEGDQETLLDAERIRATRAKVVQINTGSGCHLDADMLAKGLASLDPPTGSVVMIENVGNLVCPALFDLGEWARVVIMSVTEGADKPLKYPHMFRTADLMLVNKVDLAPYVEFDIARCVEYARSLRPGLDVLEVSATRGDGLDGWYAWLRDRHATSAPSGMI
ncbi:MAG TPA: hydrogenase nickel incorporation protein HypB [Cryptosporangiaceae bacterium]|nr:hydrogenase nickel incorporation protein HypB [Cryptosporangiaceae bacterium]